MRPRRRAIISLILPLLAACGELPTDSAPALAPQFGVGSPRFLEGNGSVPNIEGNMFTSFKMAGLGPDASTLITASADASGLWGCMTGIEGEFDLFPAPLRVSDRVSVSSSFGQPTGQFSGAVMLTSPAVPLYCAPSHRLVPITTTFANVQLSHPNAPTFNIQGLFDIQNYFLHFEVVPTMTSVVLNETTLVLGGAATTYSVTINNPGSERTNALVQGWIRQGSIYRAADGIGVLCAGYPDGTLPTGDCTFSYVTAARNAPAVGNGDLVPGPAVFELHLKFSPSSRVMAGFAVPITLTN
jgi:hypothetical protein